MHRLCGPQAALSSAKADPANPSRERSAPVARALKIGGNPQAGECRVGPRRDAGPIRQPQLLAHLCRGEKQNAGSVSTFQEADEGAVFRPCTVRGPASRVSCGVAFSASIRATTALSEIYPAPNWTPLAARGQDVRGRVHRDVHARWNRYARPSSAASASWYAAASVGRARHEPQPNRQIVEWFAIMLKNST